MTRRLRYSCLEDEVQGMQAVIVEVIGQMVREAVLQAIKEVCNL